MGVPVPHSCLDSLFNSSHCSRCCDILAWFNFHVPNDFEYLMCLSAYIIFGEVYVKMFCPLKVFLIKFWEVFVYSGYTFFITYMIWKYFFPVHGLFFHFLNNIFQGTKILNFDEVQLTFFFFFALWIMLLFSYFRSLPNSWSLRFSPMFSCRCLIILTFTFIVPCAPLN